MERSLTVLLPVHNVQSSLAATVAEVLEVVSELTERFELLIVDDGSSDATGEVAHELTTCYPQVRAIYHGECLGREAAVRTGLEHSSGEIVFFRDESSGLAIDGVPKLWRAACEHPVAAGRSQMPDAARQTWIGAPHSAPGPGYQMIDRRTAAATVGPSRPVRPNFLSRLRHFALGE